MSTARLSWFPAWQRAAVAIVASGPSAKQIDIAALQGLLPIMAVKRSHELCDADVIYGCDAAWWRANSGLPNYTGLKVAYDKVLTAGYPSIKMINIDRSADRILTDRAGVIGSGGNSGFQALNLAVQFGATSIMLIGFDCQDRSGVHWYGRNNWASAANPDENNFIRWRRAFAQAAKDLQRLGIDVVNVSAISTLKCFRYAKVDAALKEWGICAAKT